MESKWLGKEAKNQLDRYLLVVNVSRGRGGPLKQRLYGGYGFRMERRGTDAPSTMVGGMIRTVAAFLFGVAYRYWSFLFCDCNGQFSHHILSDSLVVHR
jgi:hypothetical protein